MFRTVGRLRVGYDPDQVDDFFAHARRAYEGDRTEPLTSQDVRRAAFDLVRRGYVPTAVDAALDRLERAFAARQRGEHLSAQGQQGWMEHLSIRARTLYERLRRPDGKRFAPPRRREQGYRPADVDAVCRRVIAYFDNGTTLASDDVRQATFRAAKGRHAYAEAPVDAFLDRVTEVLLGVE